MSRISAPGSCPSVAPHRQCGSRRAKASLRRAGRDGEETHHIGDDDRGARACHDEADAHAGERARDRVQAVVDRDQRREQRDASTVPGTASRGPRASAPHCRWAADQPRRDHGAKQSKAPRRSRRRRTGSYSALRGKSESKLRCSAAWARWTRRIGIRTAPHKQNTTVAMPAHPVSTIGAGGSRGAARNGNAGRAGRGVRARSAPRSRSASRRRSALRPAGWSG